MTERLARMVPSSLSDVQRSLYDSILEGPRTKVQQFPLTAPDGSLNGPFGLMLWVPRLGKPLQALGAELRYGTSLSARVREIAILAVARATRSSYETYAHEIVGRSVGLTDGEVRALRLGQFEPKDPKEACVVRLCTELAAQPIVQDSLFDEAAVQFAPTQILEIVVLAGYYRTIAQMMAICGVSADPTPDIVDTRSGI